MMAIRTFRYLLMSSLLLTISSHAALPDQTSMLTNACAGCHGPDGSSQGPATPSIAEISYDYFISSMTDFKQDERPSTIMNRIAKGYSDEQIELMANFFSQQKMHRTMQKTDPALVELGDALHAANCENCHDKGGRVSEDDSGILAGQKIPYLRYTIQDILNEERYVSKKMFKRLRSIHEEIGPKGIEQLLHYYGSQN